MSNFLALSAPPEVIRNLSLPAVSTVNVSAAGNLNQYQYQEINGTLNLQLEHLSLPANVETPVTFSVVAVAPTPEILIPPLNVAIPVVLH